ncbi:carboxylesterase family protein [Williamsia sterculiae]|uniref:Carboxylic ester hydrolase n=1 Tax=Williamsia sterculiae TaxID=1344003 RepID=A0A1N7FGW2_9NOCA|nr:carboxylesterase family protein [Williamsia sterculiae]SIR99609.1 para-nitrobenzyl esterase [Williamsia sterculiae]
MPLDTRTTRIATPAGELIADVADGVVRARGIPYGVAERFRRPHPHPGWTEPRDARVRGPAAPQISAGVDSVAGAVVDDLEQSENCQVLSVFAPVDAVDAPVMVWLHGGAYMSGAGESPKYDADDLAREGVVVVTVTYRLGVLGYLNPCDPAAENLGLRDQLLALEWVRDSVAAFGGDPGSVTVFGHSAGGDSVVALMLAPPATGLFTRAIVQSAPLSLRSGRDRVTEAQRVVLRDELADPVAASVGEVLAAQLRAVVRAADFGRVGGLPFAPVQGCPPVAPTTEADARLADAASRIELLIGHTVDDATPFVAEDPRAMRVARLGRVGRAVLRVVARRITAQMFAGPAHDFAAAWRRHGGRCATYVFDWAPRDSPHGSCHSIELPFLFGADGAWADAPMLAGERPDPDLAARMRRIWAAFARDGLQGLPADSLRLAAI